MKKLSLLFIMSLLTMKLDGAFSGDLARDSCELAVERRILAMQRETHAELSKA